MKTSIFNNNLDEREKLYFSILRTVKEFNRERVGSVELNGLHRISHL